MKIIHTSDWHLGRMLYGKKRYDEFQLFLNWMLKIIQEENPNILIIAGDIFDTTSPTNKAQEMYYNFLSSVAINSSCEHIVIIGGNHDSPTLLNAPNNILKHLKIHVIGSMTENLEDEVLLLKDKYGNDLAYVCAIPYLRDRDLLLTIDGDSETDRNIKITNALKNHYAMVCGIAFSNREKSGKDIPIIATGHLFTAGGKTESDDGVRDLYVGSLTKFKESDFPSIIDYLALGHLHIQQIVNGNEHIRYSGSPIPMGFGEIKHPKIILSVQFEGKAPKINKIKVPMFQKLHTIEGDIDQLTKELNILIERNESIWVEVNYTGSFIINNLQQQLSSIVANSKVELIKIYNRQLINQILTNNSEEDLIELNSLTELQVFEKCLLVNEIDEEQTKKLIECYKKILIDIKENDLKAE